MKKLTNYLLLLLLALPVFNLENKEVIRTNKIEYREPIAQGSNYLSNVTIKDVDFTFNRDVVRYIIDVPYTKSTLDLTYTKEDESAIVEVVGGNELTVGENSIAIIVTNSAGEAREYDFRINRGENEVNVLNEEFAIKDAISNSEYPRLVVSLIGEATKLDEDALEELKKGDKELVYEWKNSEGRTIASLAFKSNTISDEKEIDPNIKDEITSKKLLDKLSGINYVAFSTKDTGIPNGSIYRVYVDEEENVSYTLLSDKDGILSEKTANSNNHYVEFTIENGVDYALALTSEAPKSIFKGFNILWPVLIIVVVLGIVLAAFKLLLPKIIKKSHTDKPDSSLPKIK